MGLDLPCPNHVQPKPNPFVNILEILKKNSDVWSLHPADRRRSSDGYGRVALARCGLSSAVTATLSTIFSCVSGEDDDAYGGCGSLRFIARRMIGFTPSCSDTRMTTEAAAGSRRNWCLAGHKRNERTLTGDRKEMGLWGHSWPLALARITRGEAEGFPQRVRERRYASSRPEIKCGLNGH
jgi:hypothetical protein